MLTSIDEPQSAPAPPSAPKGISAFPDLDEPRGSSDVRVTGVSGTGDDIEREQFESAFPDLSGEVPYEAVSLILERYG